MGRGGAVAMGPVFSVGGVGAAAPAGVGVQKGDMAGVASHVRMEDSWRGVFCFGGGWRHWVGVGTMVGLAGSEAARVGRLGAASLEIGRDPLRS